MIDVLASSSATSQMSSIGKCLKKAEWTTVKDNESGYVFTDAHLASNWKNVYVHPESLPQKEVLKGMRKVTSPVLLLKSHSSKMAFIMASETSPVYFSSPFKRDKIDGYTMLFSLMPHVLPEYFLYLAKYRPWNNKSHQQDEWHSYDNSELGFNEVGISVFDGLYENIIYAETVFLNGLPANMPIPPISQQRQQIDDAKIMEQIVLDQMSEKERKFQHKEWLNEAHIRNCKHRLSNDIMPIHIEVNRLGKFIAASTDGIKLSSIIGQATQQTVENLLKGLTDSIRKIEEDIKVLTEIESEDRQLETLKVEQFTREYSNNFVSRYNNRFPVYIDVKDENLKIRISRHSLTELFENIFSNAVRHGFTDNDRDDYKIFVTISETNEGYCRIDIANNGNPISEIGRKEYFVRGSFAGKTGHTGLGGARVFEICEGANGKAIEPYGTADFPVVVSVEFPIVSL